MLQQVSDLLFKIENINFSTVYLFHWVFFHCFSFCFEQLNDAIDSAHLIQVPHNWSGVALNSTKISHCII